MIDKNKLSVYMHLFYKDPSIYLIEKVASEYEGDVCISLNDTGKDNDEIISFAEERFKDVKCVTVKNKGNDQYGFFKAFQEYPCTKEWTFYCHDKTIKRIDWLDKILEPIFSNEEKINDFLCSEKAGIISSGDGEYYNKMMTEEDLTELSKSRNFDSRLKIIQARHTLTWYRELQYILLTNTGFIDTENLNPFFTAGNMFIARTPIINMAHSCIHESYFENYYREDGNVEHALERFYFYLSLCMKYKNIFINNDGEQIND